MAETTGGQLVRAVQQQRALGLDVTVSPASIWNPSHRLLITVRSNEPTERPLGRRATNATRRVELTEARKHGPQATSQR
jgi:hypothetical protein